MASSLEIIARALDDVVEPVRRTAEALRGLERARLEPRAQAERQAAVDANGRALALLETAIALRQAELGRLELTPEPRRLRELMDEVEARWSPRAMDAGVTLLVSYDGDPECEVMVDWTRLLAVMDALLDRAMTRTGQGVIEASLAPRVTAKGVIVAGHVRDDGAAFDSALKSWLAADQKADITGASATPALALASHILKAMGGGLEMHANVGAGSTLSFEVTLAAPRPADQDPQRGRIAGGRVAHILVVDDNATNRMVVEALCEMFDCSTESVTDGVEAVEAARVGRFDAILMDIKMPRMDGLTATAEIRKLPGAASRPPIIALTANAGPEDVKTYLAAGMCGVVEKPIKAERLMEALESALAGAAAPDQAVAAA